MKTSFSTLACPEWSLKQIIAAATRYGYDGVELRAVSNELDLWSLPEFEPNSLAATSGFIKESGIAVACMGSSTVFHSASALERERNFDLALRMADVAAGLGAPAIRVFGDRIQDGNEREETAGWIVEGLMKLAEKLKPQGVQVWLETHGDFATTSEIGELMAGVADKDVGLIWDPANAFGQAGELPKIPLFLKDRIHHVHLKDLVHGAGGISYVLPGEGEFPFAALTASLLEIEFEGFVSFEWEKLWHPELASAEIALPRFLRWWKTNFPIR